MQGVLDAPSRLDAIITFETQVEGRTYCCETQVLLCSQPWRTFQSDAIIWKSQERGESAEAKFKLAETLTDPIEKLEMQRSDINDMKGGAYMAAHQVLLL